MVASVKVFKKCSPNGKVILYVGKREFVDHISYVEPIDGVVWVDREYVGARKVFAQLVCQFRYGREQDEVMGLSFCKELCLASVQVYPQGAAEKGEQSRLQARLIAKLGAGAAPLRLAAPPGAPASVTLQPALEDDGEPCGVRYYVKVFVGDDETDRSHRRSCVGLGVRKVQRAKALAGTGGAGPHTSVRKDFVLSPGHLQLDLSLDKQVYSAGEALTVRVNVQNHSNKSVRRVRARVLQAVDVLLLQQGTYRRVVAQADSQEGCPVNGGGSLQVSIPLVPALSACPEPRNVALEGQLRASPPQLASTTLLLEPEARDAFGIVVSYSVKVKLYLGALAGELSAELPLVLLNNQSEKWELCAGKEGCEAGAGAVMFQRGETVHHQESIDAY